jgi:hypothetical protein
LREWMTKCYWEASIVDRRLECAWLLLGECMCFGTRGSRMLWAIDRVA